jgi:hypothetical protein
LTLQIRDLLLGFRNLAVALDQMFFEFFDLSFELIVLSLQFFMTRRPWIRVPMRNRRCPRLPTLAATFSRVP